MYIAFATPKGRAAPGGSLVINGYSFIAYTIDRDGAFERVTDRAVWSSSDEVIARPQAVSVTGTKSFLGLTPGNASAVARFQGLEATAPMLIVESATVNATPRIDLTWTGQIAIGSVSAARALFRPSQFGAQQDVTNSATWTSSNPEVATVERGALTAINSGSTIITASFEGLVDWFWFSVIPKS